MTGIVFTPIETENSAREIIEFDAVKQGRQIIKCAVTYQALYDHFDAEYSDPLFAFMSGRSIIESLVSQRIVDNLVEKSNRLLLQSSDF
ncbi:MAG: DUF1488 family protein [Sedimenticola sp.]